MSTNWSGRSRSVRGAEAEPPPVADGERIGPVAEGERIAALDTIRGVALFGILV